MSRSVRAHAPLDVLLQQHCAFGRASGALHPRPRSVLDRIARRIHRQSDTNKWFAWPHVVACNCSCKCTCCIVNQHAALGVRNTLVQTAGSLSRPALRESCASSPHAAACGGVWHSKRRSCVQQAFRQQRSAAAGSAWLQRAGIAFSFISFSYGSVPSDAAKRTLRSARVCDGPMTVISLRW